MRVSTDIDLRKCKPGDILICKHGAICEYVEEHGIAFAPYQHYIKYIRYRDSENDIWIYPKDSHGTRTNEGLVGARQSLVHDADVILIIHMSEEAAEFQLVPIETKLEL